MTLAGCDAMLYDKLEPCHFDQALQFRWDYNMLFADAFSENVSSVAVFAFDEDTETLAWTRTEKGDALSQDGYRMYINDVPAGRYKVVAWCGLENDGLNDESFLLSNLTEGVSTLSDLYCRMQREIQSDGSHHSSSQLYDLFHGTAENVVVYSDDGNSILGDHIYTVNLKKDTNSVRIILQQLSGEDIDADNFTYTIEESNGLLNHDNSLLDDEIITYHPWQQKQGLASVITEDTRAEGDVKVAIADLSVSRLMADRQSILTIKNGDEEIVARIPLTDYALLVKDNYNREMTDQEYLDRQDTYTLTFFLDRNQRWVSASIIINSWRVVFGTLDFE